MIGVAAPETGKFTKSIHPQPGRYGAVIIRQGELHFPHQLFFQNAIHKKTAAGQAVGMKYGNGFGAVHPHEHLLD